jgi:hypothetical protein
VGYGFDAFGKFSPDGGIAGFRGFGGAGGELVFQALISGGQGGSEH